MKPDIKHFTESWNGQSNSGELRMKRWNLKKAGGGSKPSRSLNKASHCSSNLNIDFLLFLINAFILLTSEIL